MPCGPCRRCIFGMDSRKQTTCIHQTDRGNWRTCGGGNAEKTLGYDRGQTTLRNQPAWSRKPTYASNSRANPHAAHMRAVSFIVTIGISRPTEIQPMSMQWFVRHVRMTAPNGPKRKRPHRKDVGISSRSNHIHGSSSMAHGNLRNYEKKESCQVACSKHAGRFVTAPFAWTLGLIRPGGIQLNSMQ